MLKRIIFLFFLLIPLLSACGDQDPEFEALYLPEDTTDTSGPYLFEVYINAPRGVDRIILRVAMSEGSRIFSYIYFDSESLSDDSDEGTERWVVELPGRPAGTVFEYFIAAYDLQGARIAHPADADTESGGREYLKILSSLDD